MNATERFWEGEFGDDYVKRVEESPVGGITANMQLFYAAIGPILKDIESIVELGAGIGYNLSAISQIRQGLALSAVEINALAIEQLLKNVRQPVVVYEGSITNPGLHIYPHDLAFTKGVLIHVPPADLPAAYAALFKASKRYIMVAEYYCPTPRMIPYRGHDDRLWARDFAGEMMKAYPLRLVDYGFISKYDQHPQDDLTWMLMEKR